jgi:hypothetical protein
MNQNEKAKRFAELHMKGAPLLLYNAWDAGSAKSILEAGAPAIATSSGSVAEAQGYRDGEAIPIELAEQIIGRIAATIDIPVTVDFEGGYSEDDGELAYNIARLLGLGVIGINFETGSSRGPGFTTSTGRAAGLQPSAVSRRIRPSDFSSTRGRTCSWTRAGMQHTRSAKLWTGPRHTRPRAHRASSFPACETLR